MNETSPRRRRLAVSWAISALVMLGALAQAASSGAAPERTPDPQLLTTYQPVLVFHPSELFRPTKVQAFVADSQLEQLTGLNPLLDGSWTSVDPDPEPGELPPVTPGALYRLNQVGCEADAPLAGRDCYAAAWSEGSGGAAMYGRVARTADRIVLQYWLFYYDNPLILPPTPPPLPPLTFWQSHEGDWEVVNVILGVDETPLEAAYSQHCSGQRKAWAAVAKRPAGSTHPLAYVALGSHANFFALGAGALGVIQINPTCIPFVPAQLQPFVVDQVVDGSASGAVIGPPGSGVVAAPIHEIEGKQWSVFGGRWGETEYFFTPIPIAPGVGPGAIPAGLAPASPALQSTWNPATILGWPPAP